MVNKKGSGVSIVISTETSLQNEWLSFASWYSLYRNLPEAKVILASARGEYPSFNWPHKFSTKVIHHKKFENNKLEAAKMVFEKNKTIFVIDQNIFAVRGLTDDLTSLLNSEKPCVLSEAGFWCFHNQSYEMLLTALNKIDEMKNGKNMFCEFCDVRIDYLTTFATLGSKCGRFDLESWRNKYSVPPFSYAHRFKSSDITVNESKILDLWKRIAAIFETIK